MIISKALGIAFFFAMFVTAIQFFVQLFEYHTSELGIDSTIEFIELYTSFMQLTTLLITTLLLTVGSMIPGLGTFLSILFSI